MTSLFKVQSLEFKVQEEADASRRGEPMCSPENAKQIISGQTHRSAPTVDEKEPLSTYILSTFNFSFLTFNSPTVPPTHRQSAAPDRG